MIYDKIIIGAGLYGLYAALYCGKQGQTVLVLEHDSQPFERATYANQARVHLGYHYPRSYSTAMKSKGYFDRFNEEFEFCISNKFTKIYAISNNFSWTNKEQFIKFCLDTDIRCDEIPNSRFFRKDMCEGAFLTTEYAFDAILLKNHLLTEISKYPNISIVCDAKIKKIESNAGCYDIMLEDIKRYSTPFVLNATYASVNQVHAMLGFPMLKIKYELCEIIICKPGEKLRDVGITVMDGAFFSIMPFGKTGYHSLTSVTFTPHVACHEALPSFSCQVNSNGYCSSTRLGNCNLCTHKPVSAWPYMSRLARKYMAEDYDFEYSHSLYSIKPILKASEIDDSRPTVIRKYSANPSFVSALSGKINTVYELEEVLN